MSFPAYLAYQDSGISWIGPVPAGWAVKRLRFLAQVQTGIAKGKDVQGIETIRVPYLRVANVQDGFIDTDDVSEIEIAATDLGRYLLRPGDVLMNEGGDFDKLGRGQVWNGAIDPCIHQNHVFAVRPHGIEPEWLALVTSADCGRFFFMTRAKQSTNLASISSTNLLELPVPCPPPAERRAIMRFLDRETGKIDALVAEQERLIALLKEKRQAVISQAVTKGLDPNAPMKDSGMEWLGEVPAHWQVKRLRFLAQVQTGIAKGKDVTGVETVRVPYLGVANVQDGFIDTDDVGEIEIAATDLARYLLRSGDVLMNEGGDFDKLGRGQVWDGAIDPCIHQNHVFAVRPHDIEPEWLALVTSADCGRFFFMTRAKQSTNLASISSTNLLELPVPCPNAAERLTIIRAVRATIAELDTLSAEANRAVALLRERRAALISAAVTGKIDVRGLVASDEAKAA